MPMIPQRISRPRVAEKITTELDSLASSHSTGPVTPPGIRPFKYQAAINYSIQVPAGQAVPIIGQRLEVDSLVVDVYTTAANSVFFGYGSQVTITSGIEVRPGFPLPFGVESTREQWELQQPLELMAAVLGQMYRLLSMVHGFQPEGIDLGQYKAPRNVIDASSYYLVATAATNVAIMLFPVSFES